MNTIGSLLFGCSQIYYGDVKKQCSPLCIGNLHSFSNDNGCGCEYQVWRQNRNKKYVKVNNVEKSNVAYIYLENSNIGFEYEDVENFKKNGVKKAIVFSTKNSKHELLLPLCPISQLPINYSNPILDTIKPIIKPINLSHVLYLFIFVFFIVIFFLIISNY